MHGSGKNGGDSFSAFSSIAGKTPWHKDFFQPFLPLSQGHGEEKLRGLPLGTEAPSGATTSVPTPPFLVHAWERHKAQRMFQSFSDLEPGAVRWPPGLGLHEPVVLPVVIRTGALSCLTHRLAAADPRTPRASRQAPQLSSKFFATHCLLLVDFCPQQRLRSWPLCYWRTAKFSRSGKWASFAQYSGELRQNDKAVYLRFSSPRFLLCLLT